MKKKSDGKFVKLEKEMDKRANYFAVGIVAAIVLGLALLTKVGAIPNYLDIDILCPSENSTFDGGSPLPDGVYKPAIYLYPTARISANVRLEYDGELTATYPNYNQKFKGWNVTALPDGQLINKTDGKQYSYLFWEGRPNQHVDYDMSKGFVVEGSKTREFLQEILPKIGLTPKEYNEFIVFWYPLMKDNAYNQITFAGSDYTDHAKLTVSPAPDSTLRVFMVYRSLKEETNITPQVIKPFVRQGFTIVEWGGTRLD